MTTTSGAPARRGLTLTQQIFIGLALGVAVGLYLHQSDPGAAVYFKPFSQLFLRLIKMIIAPLIFATLVAGIAGRGPLQGRRPDGPARDRLLRGRHDARAASSGCVAVNVAQAGRRRRAAAATKSDDRPRPRRPGIRSCCTPCRRRSSTRWPRATCCRSSSSACSSRIALGMIGEKGRPVVAVVRERWPRRCSGSRTSSCTTRRSASRAAIAVTVGAGRHGRAARTSAGWSARSTSRWRCSTSACCCRWRCSSRCRCASSSRPCASRRSSRSRRRRARRRCRARWKSMERLGCPRRIVSFVLPLGYTFNLDGTTLYLSLASIFVAQAAGVHLIDRPADHDAADADADEQGRRRRAARVARHSRRHARQLRPAARGRDADPRRRRDHGHGADDDERHRQLPGDRRRRRSGKGSSGKRPTWSSRSRRRRAICRQT